MKRYVRRVFFQFAYHLFAKRKLKRADKIRVLGFELTIFPSVFHAGLFFSTRILARHVGTLNLKGKQVLEIGSGSGLVAIVAASQGACVTATDINPKAVECTHLNARANHLEDKIQAVVSDLFHSPSTHRMFDYIIWNPPFYPIQPSNEASRAWNAGTDYQVLRRFAQSAGVWLAESGTIVLILTSDIDTSKVLSFFSSGFIITPADKRKRLFETFTIFHICRR